MHCQAAVIYVMELLLGNCPPFTYLLNIPRVHLCYSEDVQCINRIPAVIKSAEQSQVAFSAIMKNYPVGGI